ncbi:hypothetical protein PISMIDRAFT_678360 [Pisolithus microcarpus 441]|uniref:Uncharacterized protein n=1 Tax=Pisolithus microcarpus 441 TaxID=765257 RepID=A0A0C9YH41_9AGAM|nr:hypothetical protein PISMIDRAFT_678360 [Pisolithus microcarpus 441]
MNDPTFGAMGTTREEAFALHRKLVICSQIGGSHSHQVLKRSYLRKRSSAEITKTLSCRSEWNAQ